ncbi:MAG: DUF2953 domain-containing protein [Candidatus Bipolaricaulota bacterium]
MIYIIVIAGLLGLLLFLLWSRLRISFKWGKAGLSFSIRYLKLSYNIYSGSGDDTSKESAGEDIKGKESLKKTLRWLELTPDLFQAAKTLVKLLVKHGRVTSLRLRGSIGTDDPYLTGIYCGYVQMLEGVTEAFIPEANIDIRPDFEERGFDLFGKGQAEIRLASILLVGIIILWQLPKRQIWNLLELNEILHSTGG